MKKVRESTGVFAFTRMELRINDNKKEATVWQDSLIQIIYYIF